MINGLSLLTSLRRLAVKTASPSVLFYAMPWLIVLLIIGTLAQKEMGLYLAHKIYFSSWVFWVGSIPLPGTYITLGLITLSLSLKFLLKSPLKLQTAGTWLSHFGILVLLIGGLLTAITQKEGFIVLPENEQTNIVSDYHHRSVGFYKNDVLLFEHDFTLLQKGLLTTSDLLPFNVHIQDKCENCLPAYITDPGDLPCHGMAAKVDLTRIPPEKENEMNFSGLSLHLTNLNDQTNGLYILMEEMSPEISLQKGTDTYLIRIGRAQRALPFHIQLIDFEKQMHPATNTARSYHSDIKVLDGAISWPTRIEMNEPLRYKGYTLYQSSFSIHPDGTEHSILSVVENKGRLFPYIASFLIGLGLIIHLLVRIKPKTKMRSHIVLILISLLGLSLPSLSYAQTSESLDMESFKQLPILHMGRIKPMDSFARTNLKILRGSETINGVEALQWLAKTLFDPGHAVHDPVFRVFKPDIVGLEKKDKPYYSYSEVASALLTQKDTLQELISQNKNEISKDQKLLLDLHEAGLIYTQLLRSFSAQLPINVDLPESLAQKWNIDKNKPLRLSQFQRYMPQLEKQLQTILKNKGYTPQNYSEEERSIVEFAYALSVIDQAGYQNRLLRIYPMPQDTAETLWISPWALSRKDNSQQNTEYLNLWIEMIHAYRTQDQTLWKDQTQKALALIQQTHRTDPRSHYTPYKINLELVYNTLHPLGAALAFFTLTLVLCLFSRFTQSKNFYRLTYASFTAAIIFNISVIALRILILDRPPVGTLYESLLFVSVICALIALIIEHKRKDFLGMVLGALSSTILLFISASFEGPDSLQVLVAVLNTNFWLTTHVLIITAGYGWCIIAACAAHAYLFLRLRGQTPPSALQNLLANIKTLALISLLFTCIGTILGGIWADQSWGRFWGWDPKENGALLIVLWLIWVLHGQLSGHLKPLIAIALYATLNIIVALAWFGVNLLSTGLHSYGFIDGVAGSLALFCVLEIILIFGCTFKISMQEQKHVAA